MKHPDNEGNDNAAIEALIAASLRLPDSDDAPSLEEISRYLDQRITLTPDDSAALEKNKEDLIAKAKDILQPSQKLHTDKLEPVSRANSGTKSKKSKTKQAPEEFVEAIVIALITRLHSSPEYPLGRKRCQKLAYLAHRNAEDNVQRHFLKKAAGPYSPWARYQGPENIAIKNGYVKRAKCGAFEGLVIGDNIDQIDLYISNYSVCASVNWVIQNFRYRKNDDLELLATVDFAALDLRCANTAITLETIKHVIASNEEWKAKLKREIFCDVSIARALEELQNLFPTTYQCSSS